jgi:hypothetical protein
MDHRPTRIGGEFPYHPPDNIKPRVFMAEVYIPHPTLVVLGRWFLTQVEHRPTGIGIKFLYHQPVNIKPQAFMVEVYILHPILV